MTTYKTRAEIDAAIAKLQAERDALPPEPVRPRVPFCIVARDGYLEFALASASIRNSRGYPPSTHARVLLESDFAPPEEAVEWAADLVVDPYFKGEACAAEYILHMDRIAKEAGE